MSGTLPGVPIPPDLLAALKDPPPPPPPPVPRLLEAPGAAWVRLLEGRRIVRKRLARSLERVL